MRPTVCRVFVLALIAAIGVAAVRAQDSNEPRAMFFAPLEVPLVSVEVYISGKDGRPVPGLTLEDFEIYEDGTQVDISHFYASPALTESPEAAPAGESEPDEVGIPETEPGQDLYLVIYFDDTNLGRGTRQAAVKNLRTFLANELPPDLKIMLVRYDGGMHVEQGFTEETDEVVAAIDRMKKAASISRQINQTMILREIQNAAAVASTAGDMADASLEESGRSTYQSIGSYADQTVFDARTGIQSQKQLIRSLSGLNGRKAVLLVSDGVEPRPGEMLYRAWAQVFERVPAFRVQAQRAFLQASRNDLSSEFAEIARFANGHRVSFYTLSDSGARQAQAVSAERRLMDEQRLAVDQGMSQEVLMSNMAGLTGGRYLVNSPGLADQLDEVSEELASYYSLAFKPNHMGDGKYHKLDVKVKRKGIQIRHRDGYLDVPRAERMMDRTLAAAVHGVADNPLGIAVATHGEVIERDDGTFLVPVIITVPIGQLVLIPTEEEHQGRIAIILTVRNERGDLSTPTSREYPVTIPNALLTKALSESAGFAMRLAVRPGRQRIAVGLRDEIASTESITFLEVEVGEVDGSEG